MSNYIRNTLNRDKEILTCLSKYACDNQTLLSQYTILGNECHREVENICLIKSINQWGVEEEQVILKNLKRAVTKLENHLDNGLADALGYAYNCVKLFFKNQSSFVPRLCIKVFVGSQIVTLIRIPNINGSASYKEKSFDAHENTAFEYIELGDKYYVCNDVPQSVQNGKYKNRRIIRDKVLEYNKQLSKQLQDGYDDNWAECWIPISFDTNSGAVEQQVDATTCYKSTMVIPMSLLKNTLDERFIKNFPPAREADKILFGCLCLDHCNINYFDEEIDTSFAYILADTLSIFLILELNWTEYSPFYKQAIEILHNTAE